MNQSEPKKLSCHFDIIITKLYVAVSQRGYRSTKLYHKNYFIRNIFSECRLK